MSANPPTIFVLSVNRHMGGAEKSIRALLPDVAESARVVVFVSNEEHRADLERLDCRSLTIRSLPLTSSPLGIMRAMWTVWKLARQLQPAAILANGHRGAFLLFFLRWLPLSFRPRFAVYVRDFAYSSLRFTAWAMRDFLFLAPTAAIFEHPPYRAWGITRLRHEVLVNAVLPPAVVREPEPGASRFIGCCARLVPWKGIEFLIEAFARIAPAHPTARVRIYGEPIDPEYAAFLKEMAVRLGVADRVEFHPFAQDISQVYRDGLFFVVPSLSVNPGPESFSRIIIEAWAHARPVIAFACGGPKLLIEDGVDGFLVEERNTGELATRLAELLEDPALIARLGLAGAEKARAQFAPAAIARHLCGLLLAPDSTREAVRSSEGATAFPTRQ